MKTLTYSKICTVGLPLRGCLAKEKRARASLSDG